MPFLMMIPAAGPDPAEAACEIGHGAAALVEAAAGQLLTIEDVGGDRAAQLFAFTRTDAREFLSPHHTRVFSNSYRLTLGMRLVTNRRRPIMVLGRDGGACHDLLLPAASREGLAAAGLAEEDPRDIAAAALARHGLAVPKLPDPVNLFLDVAVEPSGRLVPRLAAPAPGRAVTCRVLIDCRILVAAGASDLGIARGRGVLRVRVHNRLEDGRSIPADGARP